MKQMAFMRGKTIRVPEKLRRETARGGSPLVRVTGVEPARIAPPEPNGNATLLECFSDLRDSVKMKYNFNNQTTFCAIR